MDPITRRVLLQGLPGSAGADRRPPDRRQAAPASRRRAEGAPRADRITREHEVGQPRGDAAGGDGRGADRQHFGSQEWNDDATGYHYTGEFEVGAIFHSQTPIFQPAIESLQASDLRRSELLRPAAVTFFGVGASLHQKGVPSVAFIAGPNYLLALDGNRGHIDKLDSARFASEIRWTADLLKRLDRIPAAELAAGDSAALRPGVAG